MEDLKRVQIPAFGHWDYCDEMPITQYFESAVQAGLIRGHFFGEDSDLFKVPPPTKPAYQHHRKVKKGGGEKEQQHHHQQEQGKEQQKKQGRVYDLTSHSPRIKLPRAPKAVDEDLYQIPPELLYQKPKRKRLLRSLWSGCLGLNCVA